MNQLAKRTTTATSIQLASLGLALVNSLLVARMLGPVGKGFQALALVIPEIAANQGTFGIVDALIHFSAKERALAKIWFTTVLVFALGTGVMYSLPLFFLAQPVANLILPGVPIGLLRITCWSIPLIVFRNSIASLFLGSRQEKGYFTLLLTVSGSNLLFTSLALVLAGDIRAVLWAGVASEGFSFLVALWLQRAFREGWGLAAPGLARITELIRFGFPIFVSNLAQKMNYRLDFAIVNYLMGARETGLYSVATRIAESFLIAPRMVRLLWFAEASGVPSTQAVTERTNKLFRSGTILAVILAPAYALVSVTFLPILFGSAFKGAILPLLLLVPGMVFLSIIMPMVGSLAALQHQQIQAYAAWASFALTLVLDFSLIPIWGPAGAAVASSCAYLAFFLVLFLTWGHLFGFSGLRIELRRDLATVQQGFAQILRRSPRPN